MKYVDLSHKINCGIPVYPGDMEVSLKQVKSIGKDNYTAYSFSSGMHAGTHIDGPLHMLENNPVMTEYPLECFAGKGCLIDTRGEGIIDYKAEYEKISPGDIVLIFTGVDEWYGSESYYSNHPAITEKLAGFLVSRNIKMLGVDMPSPDHPPFPIHQLLLKNGIFIVENLTNLKQLRCIEHFEVFAMPLKIRAEASLTRACARYL